MLIGFGWLVGVFMSGVIVGGYVVACLSDFIWGDIRNEYRNISCSDSIISRGSGWNTAPYFNNSFN